MLQDYVSQVWKLQLTTSDILCIPFLVFLEYEIEEVSIFFVRPHRNKRYWGRKIEWIVDNTVPVLIICLSENESHQSLHFVSRSLEVEWIQETEVFYMREQLFKGIKKQDIVKLHWSYKKKNRFLLDSWPCFIELYKNTLIFFTDKGEVYCVAKEGNHTIWNYKNTDSDSFIWKQIIGECIYLLSTAGDIYKLDAWRWILIEKENVGDFVSVSPLYDRKSDSIYIAVDFHSQNHFCTFVSFDIKKFSIYEEIYISEKLSSNIFIDSSKKYLYFSGFSGNIYAYNIQKRKPELFFNIEEEYIEGGINEYQDVLYFGTNLWNIYGVDIKKRKKILKYHVSDYWIVTNILNIWNKLYLGSVDGNLYVIDIKKQSCIEKYSIGARLFSFLNKVEDWLIVFGTNGGEVCILDTETLSMRRFQVSERITSAILYEKASRTIYVQDFMNNIYKISLGISYE